MAEVEEHKAQGVAHEERMQALAVRAMGLTPEEAAAVKAGKATVRVERR